MASLPENDPDQADIPAPLEFLVSDFIHPDNQAEIDQEQRRWRLLGFWERIKLERYVNSLARQLRRAHFHNLMSDFIQLKKQYQRAKEQYQTGAFTDEGKAAAHRQLQEQLERAKLLNAKLADLRPTFETWQHYAGWLDYEREHRRELIKERRRERRIRRDMEKESKWLQKIAYEVFRKTKGCHYIKGPKTKGGKEKTLIPKFERVIIKPDAHWFYLRTILHIPIFGFLNRMPYGVTTMRLQEDEVVEQLRAHLKREVSWFWTDQNQLVLRIARLDSPDALPRHVMWRDAMKFYPKERGEKFPYVIGVKDSRKFHWLDLTFDTNILIAGTQGSGKSNLVNGIIGTLASTHSPSDLRFIMVDMKGGMEFTHWEDLPHLLWEMAKTIEEVKPLLTRIVIMMRQRMELFRKVKAKSLPSYNSRVDNEQRLERLVIVIDEMSNFVGLPDTEEIHNLIMLITGLGRAVGVGVIACTQYPEVKVIPGRIKANIPVRLSGWMPSVVSSQVVLDTPEAARLHKMAGRFAFKRGMDQLTIQVPEMTEEDIHGVVSSALQAYTDVRNETHDNIQQPAIKIWDEERVIHAALDLTDGQLSAKRIHKLFGEESPGERQLSKLTRNVVDLWQIGGGKTFTLNTQEYRIKREGKAYIISELLPNSDDKHDNDKIDAIAEAEDLSLSPSLSPTSELAPEIETS